MFKNLNVLLRTLVLAGLVGLVGWWTLFLRAKLIDHQEELRSARSEIVELTSENGELRDEIQLKQEEIDALAIALALLKVDHRLARLEVLDQEPAPEDPDKVVTHLRFTELDANGEPTGKTLETTVAGKTVYIESLVVKFGDDYVERGDVLRGTSICLFKRLFGEDQSPTQGTEIDSAGLQPLAYTGVEGPDELHRELWERFWDYANDPDLARSKGVRAIHGEAPFIEARPGQIYRILLRSSDGLSIEPE